MKFTVAAVAALAAGVSASAQNGTAYTTEVVTAYTTYCPYATEITYGSKTYTVTEPTTLTITDCPCTVSKPVYSTSSVACSTCTAVSYPTTYPNSTVATVKSTGAYSSSTPSATPVTAGAATLSGAALAGVVGVAAFFL